MNYYMEKTLDADFDSAVLKTVEALKKEGFGVLTEIDLQQKFKEKLDVDFRKYKILGACNPAFAYRALGLEDKIGTLLPCSVIVQETGDRKTEVAAVDPVASMQAVDNSELTGIASQVKEMLGRAIDSL